jgi:RNA polymerase sigma factor (sigma-70 family)
MSARNPARSGASVPGRKRPDSGLPPFESVVELHGPALLRFCLVHAGPDRAEDVFQETMLSALRAYETVRGSASVRSWLFSIAARKTIDTHRDRARSPQPVAEPEPATVVEDAPFVDDAVWGQVRRLPAKQRQAITLRFLAGLSHREIAHVMETSEAAARRNVFEGLRRLRADLAPS